jgi:hypothetical protein
LASFEEAIVRGGGQCEASATAYFKLPANDRTNVQMFHESLVPRVPVEIAKAGR